MRCVASLASLVVACVPQIAMCQVIPPRTPSTVAAPGVDLDKERFDELRATGERLVKAIESGDPGPLLELFDRKGVVFGIDPPAIDLRELRRQFKTHRGTYCFFFDTPCLRREEPDNPNRERLYSYRDLLLGGKARQIEVHPIRGLEGGPFGNVTITIEGEPIEESGGENPLSFNWSYDGQRWKLIQVEYY